jgi:hypothetical protein
MQRLRLDIAPSSILAFVVVALAACAPGSERATRAKGAEADPPIEGKLDSFYRPTLHGALTFGRSTRATLSSSARYHAWTFSLAGRSSVSISTGPYGSSRNTDTVLYLYRPNATSFGRYLARNDDANANTLHSSISKALDAGTYLVLVKGYAADTRGTFSLRVACDGACNAAPRACVFGATFDLAAMADSDRVHVERETAVTSAAGLSALQAQQIVRAVQASAHTDVRTAAEAIARVDDQRVMRVDLWDRTNARAFVAFRYWAGDNPYGAIFAPDSAEYAAKIRDGDLESCVAYVGPGEAACRADTDCGAAFRCRGQVDGVGKCAPFADAPGDGLDCGGAEHKECPTGQGLVCAGLSRWAEGICFPVWMSGHFADSSEAPVPDGGVLVRKLVARGLTTVDMDVRLRLRVSHTKPSELRITLVNPIGTDKVVWDGASADGAIELDTAVALSGDEPVNGEWTLRIEDRARGQTGRLEGWSLYIMSRWD